MSDIVITGTGLLTAAGIGSERTFQAMLNGEDLYMRRSADSEMDISASLPWPRASLDWQSIAWPTGDVWLNTAKYANLAARAAVDVTLQALATAGYNDAATAVQGGTVMAVGSSGSDELSSIMPKLALQAESDPRPLATLLYEEVPDYSYIRGIPSQLGQFVSMATGFCGSNVAVYGETGAGGLSALSLGNRLITSGECDRVIIVGVAAPVPLGALSTLNRYEPFGKEAVSGRGPFDQNRAGVFLGYGAVAILLETRTGAATRGIHPLAQLLDCRTMTAANRSEACAALLRSGADIFGLDFDAWWASGAGSQDVDQQECHAFGKHFLAPVSSSKGTIGTAFECGALIDIALAIETLKQQCIPPIGLLSTPDPAFADIDFVIADPRGCTNAKKAVVTSLGYGAATTVGSAVLAKVES